MFRFNKPTDVVTLFHKAKNPVSVRVATLLKQVSANAAEGATEDQASSSPMDAQRSPFELNVTEDDPTPDQVHSILEYVGSSGVSSVIKGATSQNDALKKFKESRDSFQWPVVVDWNNGKAVAGGNESKILKMLNSTKE